METRLEQALKKINLKKRFSDSQKPLNPRRSCIKQSLANSIGQQNHVNNEFSLNENQQDFLSKILFKLKFKQQVKQMASQTSKKRLEQLNYTFLNDRSTADYTNNVEQLYMSKSKSKMFKNNIVQLKERLIRYQNVSKEEYEENDQQEIGKFNLFCIQNLDFPIFNRSNNIKLLWDLIVNICIVLIVFFSSIIIIYEKKFTQLLYTEMLYIISFIFFLNCLISLNTSIYKKGREQKDRKQIAIYYIKNSLFSDILPVSCFYLTLLFQQYDSKYINFSLIFFIPKVTNILKFLGQLEENSSLNRNIVNIIQLAQLLVLILFVSHIFASCWLYIGIHPPKNDQLTWLVVARLQHSGWGVQYLKSYYYATVTMITVGYGDIVPCNDHEAIFVIFSTMICCGVFAYALSQIGIIFEQLFAFENKLKKSMMIISNYMHNKDVSKDLQYQIKQYLYYYWREDSSHNLEQEQKIIQQLSDNLREELLMEANKIVLLDSPIFRDNFSDGFLSKVVPLIKEIRFTPEEKIILQGDINDQSIYFVQKGRAEMCSYYQHPTFKKQKMINKITEIKRGQCFGQVGFFTGKERSFSIRSVDFSTILVIKRQDFLVLLQEFPDDYERFCMIRDRILLNGDYQPLNMKCFACKKSTHMIGDCHTLHFLPNKAKLVYEASTGQPQKQRKYERKQKITKSHREIVECVLAFNECLEDEIEEYYFQYFPESEEDNISEESDFQDKYDKKNVQEHDVGSVGQDTKINLAPINYNQNSNDNQSPHQCTSIQLVQIDEEQIKSSDIDSTESYHKKGKNEVLKQVSTFSNLQSQIKNEESKICNKQSNSIIQSQNQIINKPNSSQMVKSNKGNKSRNNTITFKLEQNPSSLQNQFPENIPSALIQEEIVEYQKPNVENNYPIQASLFQSRNNQQNIKNQESFHSLEKHLTKLCSDEQMNQKKSQNIISNYIISQNHQSNGSQFEQMSSQQKFQNFPYSHKSTFKGVPSQQQVLFQSFINNRHAYQNLVKLNSITKNNGLGKIYKSLTSNSYQNQKSQEDVKQNSQTNLMELLILQNYLQNTQKMQELAEQDPLTKELIFDRQKEYKIYYPQDNVSNIVNNINKFEKLQKEFDLQQRLQFVNQNLLAKRNMNRLKYSMEKQEKIKKLKTSNSRRQGKEEAKNNQDSQLKNLQKSTFKNQKILENESFESSSANSDSSKESDPNYINIPKLQNLSPDKNSTNLDSIQASELQFIQGRFNDNEVSCFKNLLNSNNIKLEDKTQSQFNQKIDDSNIEFISQTISFTKQQGLNKEVNEIIDEENQEDSQIKVIFIPNQSQMVDKI